MSTYTFTLNGVTLTIKARNFFTACSVAAAQFTALGKVDSHTAA